MFKRYKYFIIFGIFIICIFLVIYLSENYFEFDLETWLSAQLMCIYIRLLLWITDILRPIKKFGLLLDLHLKAARSIILRQIKVMQSIVASYAWPQWVVRLYYCLRWFVVLVASFLWDLLEPWGRTAVRWGERFNNNLRLLSFLVLAVLLILKILDDWAKGGFG
jgi:hypothetical protein